MAGIYIHVPFCIQACHYCDFYFSTSLKNKTKVINAIKQELSIQKNYLNNAPISTIYFGGGTPSVLTGDEMTSIIDVINKQFYVNSNVECTIEANPEDITTEKLSSWFYSGINRISLGVQSFRDDDLKYMNRVHNGITAEKSIELIVLSKIDNFSVDLIYGFPKLSDYFWKKNIQKLINLKIKHISCYCLTVEKNTALFHLIKNKKYETINPERGRNQFLIAHNMLTNNGYEHYEISNFAKDSFKSKHNQNYWNHTFYLGVGPSAHSFNGSSRHWNIKNNLLYCDAIQNNKPHYKKEILSKKDIINEYILTTIRTNKGIDLQYICNKIDNLELVLFKSEVQKLIKKKLIIKTNNNIQLTLSGMLFADQIASDLFII